jgi:hypothetical protein
VLLIGNMRSGSYCLKGTDLTTSFEAGSEISDSSTPVLAAAEPLGRRGPELFRTSFSALSYRRMNRTPDLEFALVLQYE